MSQKLRRPRMVTPRGSGIAATRMIPLLRALAVLGLLLLPIQMRAGTQHPHPHALLHLLLDASDGSFDHHTLGEAAASLPHDHSGTVAEAGDQQPDIPTLGTSVSALGGLAILTALIASLMIPPRLAERIWLSPACWRGRFPALEPPPPRIASA
jgi:hypothetical protein